MNIIGYIGVAIAIAAVFVWIVGRIVTENAGWGKPWVWIIFGIGNVIMWISPFLV